MSTFNKLCAMGICLLFVLFTVLGCTPDVKDTMNLPNKDFVSTANEEEPADIGGSLPESEQPSPESEQTSPEETKPGVVWTPFV